MISSLCTKCGTALTADDQFCPKCGTPAPRFIASSSDPTDSSTVPNNLPQKEHTNYGSPPHRSPRQNPYDSNPYGPPPPPRRLSVGQIALIGGLVSLFIVVSGVIYYATVVQPTQMHVQATGTTQAQMQQTANTNATHTVQQTATAQAQITATSQAQLNATATASAIAIGPPIGFSATTLHPGDAVRQSIPITIKGTYSSAGSGHVWVVLEDNLGQYYLQTPPVKFNGDRTWVAMHINPGPGITMVDFVYVTAAGNAVFWKKVANAEYSSFLTLPDGSQVLQAIPIRVNP